MKNTKNSNKRTMRYITKRKKRVWTEENSCGDVEEVSIIFKGLFIISCYV